ncbi:MAG: FecR domain-containing protein [Cyclobacteriaceae bacterium]
MAKSDYTDDKRFQEWMKGEISDEEILSEISKEEFLKYKQILQEIDSWVPANTGFLPSYDKIVSQKEAKIRKLSFGKIFLAAASISILLIASIFILTNQSKEIQYTADSGEVREILLPDGYSKVFVSGGSTIAWNEEMWSENKREVSLKGKAYFEVKRGTKFSVKLDGAEVQVLGTRFEVDQFYEFLSVTCFEGKVRATIDNKQKDIVADESYTYIEGNWEHKSGLSIRQPEWIRDNKESFQDAPLLQVIKALEVTYKLKIDYSKIKTNRKFSGSFPKDNLQLSLRVVFNPLDIKYRLEVNNLYLED